MAIRLRDDRHAGEIDAVLRDIVSAPGATERSDRARVVAGESLRDLAGFLDRVRHASYRITDEDFDMLRSSGLSEDAIFELTVAAAAGAAQERLEAAKRVLRRTS